MRGGKCKESSAKNLLWCCTSKWKQYKVAANNKEKAAEKWLRGKSDTRSSWSCIYRDFSFIRTVYLHRLCLLIARDWTLNLLVLNKVITTTHSKGVNAISVMSGMNVHQGRVMPSNSALESIRSSLQMQFWLLPLFSWSSHRCVCIEPRC